MIRIEIASSEIQPIIVLEDSLEYSAAAEAVRDIDPALAETLGNIATIIHDEGVAPDSTRLIDQAAAEVIYGLEVMSERKQPQSLLASLILEDARVIVIDPEAIEWPEGDIAEYLQSLPQGPHTGPAYDPDSTGGFRPQHEWLTEARRVPLEIS